MSKFFLTCLRVILAGILVGVFIAFFQFCLHEIYILSMFLMTNSNHLVPSLTLLVSFILSIIIIYYNKKIPGYTGSGVPQYLGYQDGFYIVDSYKMFVLIFINSLFGFFFGFLLGGEGPSISISSSIGQSVNSWFKKEDKELVTSCGMAGFSCAFMAPLAGLFYLIEENKKNISLSLIIKGIFVILISYITIYFIYPHDLLGIKTKAIIPFKYFYVYILLLVVSLIIAKLYIILIVKLKDISQKIPFWSYLLPVFVLLFMLFRRYIPYLVGTGNQIITAQMYTKGLDILLGILIFRLLGTAVSSNLSISGGLVLPMLTVGALGADIAVSFVSIWDRSILEYGDAFLILGMFIVFGIVCKTPLTALVLGIDLLPWQMLIPLFIMLMIGYLLFDIFKNDNIYEELEKRLSGYNKMETNKKLSGIESNERAL